MAVLASKPNSSYAFVASSIRRGSPSVSVASPMTRLGKLKHLAVERAPAPSALAHTNESRSRDVPVSQEYLRDRFADVPRDIFGRRRP
jgi:hypothetical protein